MTKEQTWHVAKLNTTRALENYLNQTSPEFQLYKIYQAANGWVVISHKPKPKKRPKTGPR